MATFNQVVCSGVRPFPVINAYVWALHSFIRTIQEDNWGVLHIGLIKNFPLLAGRGCNDPIDPLPEQQVYIMVLPYQNFIRIAEDDAVVFRLKNIFNPA